MILFPLCVYSRRFLHLRENLRNFSVYLSPMVSHLRLVPFFAPFGKRFRKLKEILLNVLG